MSAHQRIVQWLLDKEVSVATVLGFLSIPFTVVVSLSTEPSHYCSLRGDDVVPPRDGHLRYSRAPVLRDGQVQGTHLSVSTGRISVTKYTDVNHRKNCSVQCPVLFINEN